MHHSRVKASLPLNLFWMQNISIDSKDVCILNPHSFSPGGHLSFFLLHNSFQDKHTHLFETPNPHDFFNN